jgi:hypothetical protein
MENTEALTIRLRALLSIWLCNAKSKELPYKYVINMVKVLRND